MTGVGPTGVFIGGTGRSGTTVLSHMLAAGPQLARTVPTEVRFLTDRGGLLDLLACCSGGHRRMIARMPLAALAPLALRRRLGVVSEEQFTARMRGWWFNRDMGDGRARGLHRGMTADDLDRALADFISAFTADPLTSARTLAETVLGTLCGAPDASVTGTRVTGSPAGWIESTPDNARAAAGLLTLLPAARVVHVVRDGRDTAASVIGRSWGPSEPFAALRWWERRLTEAYRGLERSHTPGVLTVRLEDLVIRHRRPTFERLIGFLNLDGAAEWAYLTQQMPPERSHAGRWQSEIPGHLQQRFTREYFAALRRVRHRFGSVPPTEDLDSG